MKIIVHQIYAIKDPVNSHQSVTTGTFYPQHLTIFCFYDFFQIFTHVRTVKYFPWVIHISQTHTPLKQLELTNLCRLSKAASYGFQNNYMYFVSCFLIQTVIFAPFGEIFYLLLFLDAKQPYAVKHMAVVFHLSCKFSPMNWNLLFRFEFENFRTQTVHFLV